MKKLPIIAILFMLTFATSCGRVKDKTKDLVDEQADKLFPTYDHATADTDNNKKRFKEFFGFQPTQDVKDIYCFADQMGIDHDYSFSFTCDTATISKICQHLELSNDSINPTDISGLFHEFNWWDKDKIEQLTPYWTTGEHRTYYYLWYDTADTKAYYFEFDL